MAAKVSRIISQEQFVALMSREVGTYSDNFNIMEKKFVNASFREDHELYYVVWSEQHLLNDAGRTEIVYFGCNVKFSMLQDGPYVLGRFEDNPILQRKRVEKIVVSYAPVKD